MLTPYEFQWEGAHWLASRKRALLADEPGLGKTCQAILACDFICASQILVIPPASARFVWREEFDKWSMFGHDVHVIDSVALFKEGPKIGTVNIINYDLFRWGFHKKNYRFNTYMKKWLKPVWDVVIADEAHFLKEKDSLRTRAVLGANGFNGRAKRLWLLTGTPMPNHPGELWAVLAALGAVTMSHGDFIKEYCEVGTYGFSKGKAQGAKKEAISKLNKILGEVMVRRLKQFVMPELPPIRVDDFPVPEMKVNMSHFFEEAIIDEVNVKRKIKAQEEFLASVWETAVASGGSMKMIDMVRILESVGPGVAMYRRWLGAVKAVAVAKIVKEELETKAVDKIVLFAHHKQVVSYLKTQLKDYNPRVINGETSARDRERAVNNFQNDPKCRVFIGNIQSAGTAITLTAAHEVMVVEQDWVPANNAQAIMRCHRIGQQNAVRARFVRLANTLDDYICETVMRKTNDIVKVLGD